MSKLSEINSKNILESLIAEIGEYVEPVWSIEAKALLETHPDPSKIWPQFAIFLMLDETQCAGRHPQCNIVAELYKKELDGEKIDWHEAWDADTAMAAAWAAAMAAAWIAQSLKILELLKKN